MTAIKGIDPAARAVLAMAGAILLAWVVSLTGLIGFGPEAVAEAIMARTPPNVANVLLNLLGQYAGPFALLGGIACYLGLAAIGGIMLTMPAPDHVRRAASIGAYVVVGVMGIALYRLAVAPQAVLAACFAGLLTLFSFPSETDERPGRRRFLRGLLVSSAGVLVMSNIVFVDAIRRAAGATRAGSILFPWTPPAPRMPGFAEIAGLSAEMTPVESFYRMSKNVVDPNPFGPEWRLRVGSRTWTLEEMLVLPQFSVNCTLRCVSNDIGGQLMSAATFTGTRVRDLMAASAITLTEGVVVFRGIDGHADSIDVAAALDDETLIAYAMNGSALTRAHGFPARLLIPGRYGFKNIKWLSEMAPQPGPFIGHWQELGWTATAEIKTMSRIDVARHSNDGLLVAGIAFAGTRGISAVRVRLDDGPWQNAELHLPPLGRPMWVQWRFTAPGQAAFAESQAFDGTGAAQPTEARSQFPDGAQGLHRVRIAV